MRTTAPDLHVDDPRTLRDIEAAHAHINTLFRDKRTVDGGRRVALDAIEVMRLIRAVQREKDTAGVAA